MDIIHFFENNDFDEDLLLQYDYDEVNQTLAMVLNSTHSVLQYSYEKYKKNPIRTFHKIIFFNVERYRRTNVSRIFKDPNSLQLQPHGPVNSVYELECKQKYEDFEFSCCLSSFGNLEFNFHTIQYNRLKAANIGKDGDPKYLVKENGQNRIINFYDPFG